MRKEFPTLYRQSSTGVVLQWRTWVKGRTVWTEHGQKGGKLQVGQDLIKEGKNLGRSNATTPESQALAQAQQEHNAHLKKGYGLSAQIAATTKNILAAVEPMLAYPIEKRPKAAVFPARAQPKLDGMRCIAIISNGSVALFSRTQKPINSVPHITAELEQLYKGRTITLDGELYCHAMKEDFNTLMSLARRDDVHEDSKALEYHVYDCASAPGGHANRMKGLHEGKHVFLVETVVVETQDDLEEYQAKCVAAGYEGAMYRNPAMPYENKRSAGLLKVKTFQDAEFRILGVEEGAGKLMGAVGAFVMQTENGVGFKAKPMGTLELSQEYWRTRKALVGRYGTVKYQGKTPDGSLRFPVMKCLVEP